ncbi:MAG: hypothetical protein RI885_2227 [Actinomycetota bacterium]|jgi:cyclic-di-GMP-binding biofilm dispersal mediator protein
MTSLDGSVILVIGASGGLGSRIAARLADGGATVIRSGRSANSISGAGAYLADLRTDRGAASLVAAAIAQAGRLDGVVIAAGVVAFGPSAEVADATLAELFETNAIGPIRAIRAAIPALTESASAGRDPVIVTITGIVSEAPTAGLAAYSASKAALAAFVQASTRELRRVGIRLLDARPGHTETGLATRPIAGTAPAFPEGHTADAVADRIVKAIVDGEKDLPSSAF